MTTTGPRLTASNLYDFTARTERLIASDVVDGLPPAIYGDHVVYRADHHSVGVYHVDTGETLPRLPSGGLVGSGARYLRCNGCLRCCHQQAWGGRGVRHLLL